MMWKYVSYMLRSLVTFGSFYARPQEYTLIISHKLSVYLLLSQDCVHKNENTHSSGECVNTRSHFKIAVNTGKRRGHLESTCCKSTLLLCLAVIICSALQLHGNTGAAQRGACSLLLYFLFAFKQCMQIMWPSVFCIPPPLHFNLSARLPRQNCTYLNLKIRNEPPLSLEGLMGRFGE